MSHYYSKTTGGFYDSNIHETMPNDAVEVSDEDYAALFVGQSEGKVIAADSTGFPVLSDRPAVTPAQQWSAYQAKAKAELTESDTSMLRIYEAVILGNTTMEAADVVAFVKWRQALRAILSENQPDTIPTDLPARPAYPTGTGA